MRPARGEACTPPAPAALWEGGFDGGEGMRRLAVLALLLCACAPVDFRFGDAGEHEDAGEQDAGLPCGGCGGVHSLHCEADAGVCVECLSSANCFAPYGACDARTHRCVECVTSADCGTGACEVVTNHCGKSCTSIAECFLSSAPTCADGHICGVCDDENDCNNGLHCEKASGQCVECTMASDCPGDRPLCDRSHGTCVECEANADCALGRLCDPETWRCVPLP
jgi:hypothetical protein